MSSVDRIYDQNDDGLDEWFDRDPAPWWKPWDDERHPSRLKGTVVRVETGTDKNGVACPFVTVRTDEGDVWEVRGYQVVLRDKLVQGRPEVGGRIGLKYLGKSDNNAYLFDAFLPGRAKPEAAIDWDALAKTEGGEQRQPRSQTGFDEEEF